MSHLVKNVVFCIALMVVTMPDSLTLIVTFANSNAIRKLQKREALIRAVSAPEKMARCTDVCVEMTGTLTEQETDLKAIVVGGDTELPLDKNFFKNKVARRLA